ncbi:shk1 kinase-binding protein 1 [Pholiota conissans]|uniref:Shk1 kinase-binding protein 1 n=1 Tax=Pholiota conissans TaxID=109636 RepID=A0A9P5YVY4_9AGAR|nr:shk1 kinase-binding protein 1 [Pholiota conissans]
MDYQQASAWDPCATLATFLTLDDLAKASAAFSPTSPPPHHQHQSGVQVQTPATPVLKLVDEAKDKGYKRLCIPLTTAKWEARWAHMCLLPTESSDADKEQAAKDAEQWRLSPGFQLDEVTITRLDEAEGIIAMISEWLELDAADDWVRHDAEIALKQELAYASYLNIQTAILPAPRNRDHVASYARIVNSCLTKYPYTYLSIRLPIYNPSAFATQPPPLVPVSQSFAESLSPSTSRSTPSLVISMTEKEPVQPGGSLNATWEMWDLIRSMCDYNPRLTLTLDLSPALPTTLGVLSKWAAESVRYIFLPSSTFIANVKGYPVLPKPTQQFIRDSMIHRPMIILGGVSDGHHSRGGEAAYSQYVRHLEKTSPAVQATKQPGTVENFAQGYQDYLQAPLQPLMDNLPSVTYQTFEQDPVKYAQYEEAMYHAFLDRPAGERFVVCVAGAGRGPLVARCFKALERSKREATVIAVEKNPNAFVTLQHRQAMEWNNKVKLCFGDMRVIDVPEKADILVSELLGSFGDNELSPECLDGAMRFLKPAGISIPSSYTAHLAPLSSSKLYNEARSPKNEKSLETPYVVMFQAVNILSGTKAANDGRCGPQVQECWEFEHPRRDAVLDSRGLPYTNSHNARAAKMRFYIPHAGVLHGLAGYFEAILYGNIGLSIHPQRKDQVSKDMLSWFPLFFPFKEPLYLPSNSELQVSIWRLTNDRQVWYEWHAESFISIPAAADRKEELMLSTTFPATPFSAMGAPSPLIDSKEPPRLDTSRFAAYGTSEEALYDMVKIGHTSLHNPGGRSSWIGL